VGVLLPRGICAVEQMWKRYETARSKVRPILFVPQVYSFQWSRFHMIDQRGSYLAACLPRIQWP